MTSITQHDLAAAVDISSAQKVHILGLGGVVGGSVVVMVTVSEMAKEEEYLALFARHS